MFFGERPGDGSGINPVREKNRKRASLCWICERFQNVDMYLKHLVDIALDICATSNNIKRDTC